MARGLGHIEEKSDSMGRKVDNLESELNKGWMMLSNLEESDNDAKFDVDDFIKSKLRIEDGIEVVTAFRVGKFKQGEKRRIKFKLFDNNDVAVIFSNISNLKGIKNCDDEIYKITEVLSERDREIKNHYNDLKFENRKLPVTYQAEIKMKNNSIQVADKKLVPQVREPTVGDAIMLSDTELARIKPNRLWQGQEFVVESSIFCGYAMEADSFDLIKDAYQYLRNQNLNASHILCGYRIFGKKFSSLQNYSDDGEYGGGREILSILKQLNLFNTVVFVTRVRDHKNIGPARFEAIRDATKSALAAMDIVANHGQACGDQQLVKALNEAAPKQREVSKGDGKNNKRGGRGGGMRGARPSITHRGGYSN